MIPVRRLAGVWLAAGVLATLAACSGAPSKPAASPAASPPPVPVLTGRVVDQAKLLSPETEAALTERLARLETERGPQVVLVTLPSLNGHPVEAVGLNLGNTWGIGSKDRNDGVLLIVAPVERKVRIEVGFGLEGVLTNARSADIIQRAILPRFKAGDMEGGVVAGTDAIIAVLDTAPGGVR